MYYPEYNIIERYPAEQTIGFTSTAAEWGILSNFAKTQMVVNGIEFACVEQLFHYIRLNNEEERTDSIRVENFRDNSTLADKASAKVELTNIFYPIKVPFRNIAVQTVRFVHLLLELFRNRVTRSVERQNLGFNEVGRHTAK